MNGSLFCACAFCMFGILWGIFIPACLLMVPVGLGSMAVIAMKEE